MDFILGADVDATQGDGATAIHWAAHRNNHAAADLLMVATRKLADWLFDRPMANFQFLQFLAGDLSFTG